MQLDSHFEQPDLEINSAGNETSNNEKIHSHKNNPIQRIEKDYEITRKILEQHFGMTLEDAAKNLRDGHIIRLERLMSMLAKAYLFKVLNHMWSINNVLLLPKKKAPIIWVTKYLLQQEYLVIV